MSADGLRNHRQSKTEFVRILADERERERVLRERFADFWGTASAEPRAIYDAFISASPPDQ
jgi:epsilon-lactone hydrolase